MRHIFRCLVLALASLSITACSIGEGNGIVSIRIVAVTSGTFGLEIKEDVADFQLRSDQCEGLLLGVVATFTDGQEIFYSSRSEFEIVEGDADEELIANGILAPNGDSAPNTTVTVKASYLSLEATQEFTFNDVVVTGFQIEPARIALIENESADLLSVIALSDGSKKTNLAAVVDYTVDDETSFTLAGVLNASKHILNATGQNGSAEITATYCDHIPSKKQTSTITATNFSPSDVTLEIRSNFDGNGLTTATSSALDFPANSESSVLAYSVFPNGYERIERDAKWTAQNSTNQDCDAEGIECSAELQQEKILLSNLGIFSTSENTDRITTITAAITTASNIVISSTPLTLDISPIKYQTPAFVLQDESNTTIDHTQTPAVSVASRTQRSLQFKANLLNTNDEAYQISTAAFFKSAETDKIVTCQPNLQGVETCSRTITGIGTLADDNIRIDIDTSLVPGGTVEEGESLPFTNNITNFIAEVHLDPPTGTGLIIDTDDADNEENLAIQPAPGETIQLRGLLTFDKGNIDAGTSVAWSSNNNNAVTVSNSSNPGQLIVITSDSATITATLKFTDHNGVETVYTSTILVN